MANHAMYTSIKYEDIVVNELLAITISPQNQHNDHISGKYNLSKPDEEWTLITKDRPKASMKHIYKRLNYLQGSRYKLWLEFSPLGIIHYHGYIQIGDREKWATNDILLLKDVGHFCIKKIESKEKWDKYCQKQNTGYEIECVCGLKTPKEEIPLEQLLATSEATVKKRIKQKRSCATVSELDQE